MKQNDVLKSPAFIKATNYLMKQVSKEKGFVNQVRKIQSYTSGSPIEILKAAGVETAIKHK